MTGSRIEAAPTVRGADKLDRCLADLNEALELLRRALEGIESVQADVERVLEEPAHDGERPTPLRHAMPSVGPRWPVEHVVDEW